MENRSEAEKMLAASRAAAQALAGQLRTMAWRMRGTAHAVKAARGYQRGDLETDVAHLLAYCREIERLCAEHAERIYTHDRVVISHLERLARMARENDL